MSVGHALFSAEDFGKDFEWGVAIAAAQNEGAANDYGKGPSIWDAYAKISRNIKGGATPRTHVSLTTQLRTIKNSGYWWRAFLKR